MPHRAGEPLPCLTENQVKVVKAYGCIPVWLDMHGSLVCTFCNSGEEGCSSSCLQAQVMKNLRADVDFLDREDARQTVPLTIEEITSNFHKFCYHPDVSTLVNADSLYFDFIEKHEIIVVLQNLCEWLKKQAEKYAEAGGVHNQSRERLWLKCNRALSLFLRLDIDSMTEEDTIILSNIMECACPLEAHDPALYAAVQKLIDLVSVIGTFKEIRGHQETLEALILEQPTPGSLEFPSTHCQSSSQGMSQASSNPFSPNSVSPRFPLSSSVNPFSSPGVTQPLSQHQSDSNATMASPSISLPTRRADLTPSRADALTPTSQNQAGASSGTKRKYDSMSLGDSGTVRRCMGRTQSGARCKLTEESVHRLHGRCAEAAKSLVNGSNYCLFHRAQENAPLD